MITLFDEYSFTIKETIDSQDFVHVTSTAVEFYVDGKSKFSRPEIPPCEHDINDFNDLMGKLREMQKPSYDESVCVTADFRFHGVGDHTGFALTLDKFFESSPGMIIPVEEHSWHFSYDLGVKIMGFLGDVSYKPDVRIHNLTNLVMAAKAIV